MRCPVSHPLRQIARFLSGVMSCVPNLVSLISHLLSQPSNLMSRMSHRMWHRSHFISGITYLVHHTLHRIDRARAPHLISLKTRPASHAVYPESNISYLVATNPHNVSHISYVTHSAGHRMTHHMAQTTCPTHVNSRYCKCWEQSLRYDPLMFILCFSICF